MKRITILLGGQGHALMVKPLAAGLDEIRKYGLVYRKRVYICLKGVEHELFVMSGVPDPVCATMAENAIGRGFVSEC